MADKTNVLGIDIGSISISLAVVDRDRTIGATAYAFHRGKIAETLHELLSGFDLPSIGGIAATSSSPEIIAGAAVYDSRVSVIRAAKHLHDRVGSILIVGGEKFGLVLFDGEGEYLNYRSNTSCAAGTGSFLDQQATRLGLSGIHEFSELAFRNSGSVPKIASRCAVFAKTDLIHAQQEGYSREEICDGLSFGLARNIADTLFSNAKPEGPMVFCGGVSKNRAVVKHFSRMLDIDIITHEHSHLYGAIGAALNFIDERPMGASVDIAKPDDVILVHEKKKDYYYDSLALTLSEYPAFDSVERYEYQPLHNDFAVPVEIDIYERLETEMEYSVF
nr:BadF/BadG/BcrA/BcrD ATPase family protein [Spirochaetota bacterium]